MEITPALRKILESKKALDGSRNVRREMVSIYQKVSEIQRITEILDGMQDGSISHELNQAIKPYIDDIEWLEDFIYEVLALSARNHLFGTTFGNDNPRIELENIFSGIGLVEHPVANITLAVRSNDPVNPSNKDRIVRFSGRSIYTKFVGKSYARCRKWSVSTLSDEVDYSGTLSCHPGLSYEYTAGEWLDLDGRVEAVTFDEVSEHCLVIQIHSKIDPCPIIADFSVETRKLTKISPSLKSLARTQMSIPSFVALRGASRRFEA